MFKTINKISDFFSVDYLGLIWPVGGACWLVSPSTSGMGPVTVPAAQLSAGL